MAEEVRNLILEQDDETVFEVSKVKDIRLWGGKIQYLIKWANTPIQNEATLELLNRYAFPDYRAITFKLNRELRCREIVWPDSWVGLTDLDCHELIMQYHIDAKNNLKDKVESLTEKLEEEQEENARLKQSVETLKQSVESLKNCVRSTFLKKQNR